MSMATNLPEMMGKQCMHGYPRLLNILPAGAMLCSLDLYVKCIFTTRCSRRYEHPCGRRPGLIHVQLFHWSSTRSTYRPFWESHWDLSYMLKLFLCLSHHHLVNGRGYPLHCDLPVERKAITPCSFKTDRRDGIPIRALK